MRPAGRHPSRGSVRVDLEVLDTTGSEPILAHMAANGRHRDADDLVAAALASGRSYREAGASAGVSERTVRRRVADPGFRGKTFFGARSPPDAGRRKSFRANYLAVYGRSKSC